jgi:hypothetical protein
MKLLSPRRAFPKVAVLAALLGLSWLLPSGPVKSEILNSKSRRYTGFTRPGSPDDRVSGDKIEFAALVDKGVIKKGLGGTIYFAVFDQAHGTSGDTYGTGVKNFNADFKHGLDFEGELSPNLDTTARYLYLYQLVNDRGTDWPLHSTHVKLYAPESVTSWGHFPGYSFALKCNLKDDKGKPLTYASGESKSAGDLIYVAVGNPAVAGPKQPTPYLQESPAYFDIKPLVETFFTRQAIPELEKRGIKLMNNLPVIEKLAVKARDPSHVIVAHLPADEYVTPTRGARGESPGEAWRAAFRVIWSGDNALRKGEMSPIYGYTSNLPPVLAPVKIRGSVWRPDRDKNAKEGEAALPVLPKPEPVPPPEGDRKDKDEKQQVRVARAVQLVSAGKTLPGLGGRFADLAREQGGAGPAPSANATAPSPAGGPGAGGGGGGVAGAGTVGTLGGGGGGGSGAPIPGLGGIGAARPAVFAGGGGNGGGNSGTGTNQGTGTAQGQSQLQPIAINNANNNFNILQQQQGQQQRQSQHQRQNNNHHRHVVPEPGAYLLLLLGLPVLLLFRRRNLSPAALAS